MAVYTPVSAAALADFLAHYDLGTAVSFKGIAEGVENSNYLLETTTGRYFLTLFEKRMAAAELPWFIALMTHCADRRLPVPRPIPDRAGRVLHTLCERPACLIEFITGVSLVEASPAEAHAVGAALGALHHATADFPVRRDNSMALPAWRSLADSCAGQLDTIAPGLEAIVQAELAELSSVWPGHLEQATIHADLFPDNVLLLDGRVTGLIDFYFACTDIRAYDLAVTHAAWCFSNDGRRFDPARAAALIGGYRWAHPLIGDEIEALPILCRGASLRFMLTRAYDWINTPPGALVTRKDPMAFARRLLWYRAATPEQVIGA